MQFFVQHALILSHSILSTCTQRQEKKSLCKWRSTWFTNWEVAFNASQH